MKFFKTLLVMWLLIINWTAYAWDEYLNIYNNSNEPLNYSASPKGSSGITPKTAVIPPYSKINVKVKDGTLSTLERWQSEGNIILRSQQRGTVTVHYHGLANFHMLKLKNKTPKTQNPMASVQLINDSRKMCNGPMNCIIVNPNMNWVKSTLRLQNVMDQYEPLTNGQQASTHNSYISEAYGKTYAVDPNQKLKVSEQLEAGVTSLELDVHYLGIRDDILLCHGHPRLGPNTPAIGCAPWDTEFKVGLREIHDWLQKRLKTDPNTFITFYLDVSLMGHVERMDNIFEKELGEYIFSRKDLADYFRNHHLTQKNPGLLPADRITKNDILSVQKHILIITKNRELDNSRFVFNKTTAAGVDLPYDAAVERIDSASSGASLFTKDVNHTSIWRILEDETNLSNDEVYANVFNMAKVAAWRVNWISMDKLTKNDSRLASLVWSWEPGFPLAMTEAKARPYAILVTSRKRLQNDIEITQQPLAIMCHDQTQASKAGWAVTQAKNLSVQNLAEAANQLCQQNLGPSFRFATPINSYTMVQAVQAAKDAEFVLVNNIYENNQWVANQRHSLTTPR